MGIAVGGRIFSSSGSLAVLRMTGGRNVRVPALYCLGGSSDGFSRGPTSYQIYVMSMGKEGGLIPTYTACVFSKVSIDAGGVHILGSEHAIMSLLLSGRPGSYLAYSGSNGYTLRGLTVSLNVGSVPFSKPVSRGGSAVCGHMVRQGPDGYILYKHYITIYSGVRSMNTLSTSGHNFSAIVDTPGRYVGYNRYIRIYPANTLLRVSRASSISGTLVSGSGCMVVRATPTAHISLKSSFKVTPKDSMAKGVVATLQVLKFGGMFSAGFNTSLAVVSSAASFMGHLGGGSGLPLVASYYPN